MTPFKASAAIFDMDGVLVDSIPIHRMAWEALAKQLDRSFSHEMFQLGNGRTAFSHILAMNWTDCHDEGRRLAAEKEAAYQRLVTQLGVKPMPGITEFLDRLQKLGIPCAVGTSAPQLNQKIMLRSAGLEHYFQALVNSDDVREGKPAPDIFLKAAALLEVDPGQCVVFEDAPLGIEAGRAAGMKVVALSFTHPASELQRANLVVDSFSELSFSQLF